uniref:Vomeronasal type-1 receptor n=1 Tax=Sciurus vulgaris TaxID=55149 RepID=A0A8D2CZJ0_SCIVU
MVKKINQLYNFIIIRNTFFSEVGLVISTNTNLLLFHKFTFLPQHRFKPTDLTIGLLALIHLEILIYGAYSYRYFCDFWNDIKCKSFIYLCRFLRGFSICATCLLSVLQAISLSPRSAFLAKFKYKSPHQSLCFLIFLWIFYMSLSAPFSYSSTAILNMTSHGLICNIESRITFPMSYFTRHLFSALGIFRDVILVGLMVLSSGYMVTLLCRDKRHLQHLQSINLFFMLMHCLDCFFSSSRTMWNNEQVSVFCPTKYVQHC